MEREMTHWRLFFGSIAFCLIGFLLFGGNIIKMFEDTDVMRNGIQTFGQVVDTSRYVERFDDGDSYQRYRVHFTFQATDGAIYSGEDTISKETYESYSIGQTIDVYYYNDNPSVSYTDLQGKIQSNQFWILLGGILGLSGVIIFTWLSYRNRDGEF